MQLRSDPAPGDTAPQSGVPAQQLLGHTGQAQFTTVGGPRGQFVQERRTPLVGRHDLLRGFRRALHTCRDDEGSHGQDGQRSQERADGREQHPGDADLDQYTGRDHRSERREAHDVALVAQERQPVRRPARFQTLGLGDGADRVHDGAVHGQPHALPHPVQDEGADVGRAHGHGPQSAQGQAPPHRLPWLPVEHGVGEVLRPQRHQSARGTGAQDQDGAGGEPSPAACRGRTHGEEEPSQETTGAGHRAGSAPANGAA